MPGLKGQPNAASLVLLFASALRAISASLLLTCTLRRQGKCPPASLYQLSSRRLAGRVLPRLFICLEKGLGKNRKLHPPGWGTRGYPSRWEESTKHSYEDASTKMPLYRAAYTWPVISIYIFMHCSDDEGPSYCRCS